MRRRIINQALQGVGRHVFVPRLQNNVSMAVPFKFHCVARAPALLQMTHLSTTRVQFELPDNTNKNHQPTGQITTLSTNKKVYGVIMSPSFDSKQLDEQLDELCPQLEKEICLYNSLELKNLVTGLSQLSFRWRSLKGIGVSDALNRRLEELLRVPQPNSAIALMFQCFGGPTKFDFDPNPAVQKMVVKAFLHCINRNKTTVNYHDDPLFVFAPDFLHKLAHMWPKLAQEISPSVQNMVVKAMINVIPQLAETPDTSATQFVRVFHSLSKLEWPSDKEQITRPKDVITTKPTWFVRDELWYTYMTLSPSVIGVLPFSGLHDLFLCCGKTKAFDNIFREINPKVFGLFDKRFIALTANLKSSPQPATTTMLAEVLWVFAKIRVRPSVPLLTRMDRLCNYHLSELQVKTICQIVWAHATLNIKLGPQLMIALNRWLGTKEAKRITDVHSITLLLWCIAVLDIADQLPSYPTWCKNTTRKLPKNISTIHEFGRVQLNQARSSHRLSQDYKGWSVANDAWGAIEPRIDECEKYCAQIARQRAQKLIKKGQSMWVHSNTTTFQFSVFEATKAHYPDAEYEVTLNNKHGHSTMDVWIESLKLGIEADGPDHFSRAMSEDGEKFVNPTHLGNGVLKTRLLKASGLRIVSVPFEEFQGLESQEQKRYMRDKINIELAKTSDV
eukprot:m.69267 g.69267  ORF g.69267 m.69267 type:complete len:674 (+) comp24071_c1_seq1:406-2427(+)